ncbi:MAG: hypothetical protein JXA69_08020 [Phycisphaerae bacterium]|nr:hypothetical protein [Phycisphaerae bacterium]
MPGFPSVVPATAERGAKPPGATGGSPASAFPRYGFCSPPYGGFQIHGSTPARRAQALGYSSHGGVADAIRRIEAASPTLRRTVARLRKRITTD